MRRETIVEEDVNHKPVVWALEQPALAGLCHERATRDTRSDVDRFEASEESSDCLRLYRYVRPARPAIRASLTGRHEAETYSTNTFLAVKGHPSHRPR